MEEAQRQRLQPCLELSPFLLCQYSPRGSKLTYLLLQLEAVRPLLRIGAGLPLDVSLPLPSKPWTSSIGVDLEVHVRILSWWRLNFDKRKDSLFFLFFFFLLCASCWLKTMQMAAKDEVGYISHHFHSSWVEPIYFVLNEGAQKPKGSLGTGVKCEGKLKHNKTPRLMVCTRSISTRRMFPDRQVQVITQHIANLSVPQPFPRELGWCCAQQTNLSRQDPGTKSFESIVQSS